MNTLLNKMPFIVGLWVVAFLIAGANADDTLSKLVDNKKFDEAIKYADDKLPPASRNAAEWTQIAKADEAINLPEKAIACYLVASRLDPSNYEALLGAAKIYNNLDQPENAADYAGKAMDLNFTVDASWEYARACITLNRPADAKRALEKIIQADPQNAVANRELGAIYFNEKKFENAAPLFRKSYGAKADANTAYMLGKSCLESGDTGCASEFLLEAATRNPTLFKANLELARVYFKQGKFRDAVSEYEKIISKIDLGALDDYDLAVSYEKTNELDSAFKAYVAAAGKFVNSNAPEALQSNANAGSGLLKKKNFGDALSHFQIIARLDPEAKTIKDVYFLLADAYEGVGKQAQAIAALENAIALDKENIEAYARLADLYETAKEPVKAGLVYKKLLSLHPNDANVYRMLGDYNVKIKKYSQALLNYEKAFDLDHSAKSAENAAACAVVLNQLDKALGMYRKVLETDPQNTEANKRLGMALMKRDSTVAAIEHLEMADEFAPQDPEILSTLAEGYVKTNRTQEAIDVLQKVKALKPDDAQIRMRLVDLYQKTGQDKKALDETKQLLGIKKDNKILLMYAQKLVSAGKYKEAEEAIQDIRATNPENIEALMVLGDAQRLENKYDAAIETYKEISYIKPDYAPANFQRAEVYMLQDKIQWAKTFYERSLEAEPKLAMAELGLAKIAKVMGDQNEYVEHLDKAMKLDPTGEDIRKEYAKLKVKPDPHDVMPQ